jgi:hypothetical protein
MVVILDILYSFIVRGSIVLVVLITMVNLNNALFRFTERASLNETVSSASETISNDLRLAGFRASKTFAKADSIEASFYADLDNNGTAETVRYYLGAGAAGSHRILYRTLNAGTPFEIARDVVLLRFNYYSITGTPLSGTTVSGIRSVKVYFMIESNHKLRSVYSGRMDTLTFQKAAWEGHLFPQGLY